jgi:hypothetical protein
MTELIEYLARIIALDSLIRGSDMKKPIILKKLKQVAESLGRTPGL